MKNDNFWEMKEREIQEKVIDKCMVQYLGGYKNISGPLWGLFFYTKQSIYLQVFPEKNVILSIVWPENKSDQPSFDMHIPWKDMTQISFPKEKSKLKKLISPSKNFIKVNYLFNQKEASIHLNFSNRMDVFKDYVAKNYKQLFRQL